MVTAVQNEGRIGWPGCGIDSRPDPDTTGIFLDSRFYIREIERRCSNSIGSIALDAIICNFRRSHTLGWQVWRRNMAFTARLLAVSFT